MKKLKFMVNCTKIIKTHNIDSNFLEISKDYKIIDIKLIENQTKTKQKLYKNIFHLISFNPTQNSTKYFDFDPFRISFINTKTQQVIKTTK